MVKVMPSFENEDQNVRVLDPLCLKTIGSLSYHKLPQQLFKLSVLKLDGSSFDVCVARNATIGELKQAVEAVFILSPKDGGDDISWSHVWGHFCLCYEGQKLFKDKVHIRNLGINDGDQLKFIRHMSINYSPAKQRFKNRSVTSRQWSMPSTHTSACEEEEQTSINDYCNIDDQINPQPFHCEDEEIQVPKFKMAHLLNGQLSYAKLRSSTRKRFLGMRSSSRFSLHCYRG